MVLDKSIETLEDLVRFLNRKQSFYFKLYDRYLEGDLSDYDHLDDSRKDEVDCNAVCDDIVECIKAIGEEAQVRGLAKKAKVLCTLDGQDEERCILDEWLLKVVRLLDDDANWNRMLAPIEGEDMNNVFYAILFRLTYVVNFLNELSTKTEQEYYGGRRTDVMPYYIGESKLKEAQSKERKPLKELTQDEFNRLARARDDFRAQTAISPVEKNNLYADIKDFEKLPDDMAERGKFAELFKRLNDYLAAAKIQGFVWKESVYRFKHEGTEDTLVTMLFDERVYGILAMRYKELPAKGPTGPVGPQDIPFDIDPYLTEIDVGQINADYMNTKFQKFVKCLSQENVTTSELDAVREELHRTFASLPQEDQKYAEMLLDDLGSGNIQLESGLAIQDYITQYKTKALNRDIDLCVNAFGLNKTLLVDILRSGHVTPGNLDEYGRFKKLMDSVDNGKAKTYLETASGTPLTMFAYRSKITSILSEFLYSGGKGEKIPKVIPHPEILSEIGDALKYNGWLPVYSFAAACGKFGAEETVECKGWIDVSTVSVGHLTDKMYVVQAKGHSMEPQIADGQYCVFEYRAGTFDPNDIVLAQHTPVQDNETEGAYSIKKIIVKRHESEDAETLQNVSIVLEPLNRDPKYVPIPLPDLGEFGNDYKIVGVLRKTL
mgnify:CR=1 FL=1